MKTIRLWHLIGLGLIIEYPTGIRCTNQTCGTLCRQPEVEGIFLPIGDDTQDDRVVGPSADLRRYFERTYGGEGAAGGITLEDAAFIDSVLLKYRLASFIAVDRARLAESNEAWIHVQVWDEQDSQTRFKLFSGFGPYPRAGVLTWMNSD